MHISRGCGRGLKYHNLLLETNSKVKFKIDVKVLSLFIQTLNCAVFTKAINYANEAGKIL